MANYLPPMSGILPRVEGFWVVYQVRRAPPRRPKDPSGRPVSGVWARVVAEIGQCECTGLLGGLALICLFGGLVCCKRPRCALGGKGAKELI